MPSVSLHGFDYNLDICNNDWIFCDIVKCSHHKYPQQDLTWRPTQHQNPTLRCVGFQSTQGFSALVPIFRIASAVASALPLRPTPFLGCLRLPGHTTKFSLLFSSMAKKDATYPQLWIVPSLTSVFVVQRELASKAKRGLAEFPHLHLTESQVIR